MLYDNPDWILGYIARSLQDHISDPGRLHLDIQKAPRERWELQALHRKYDVIHYLSPGDFYRLGRATCRPTVVTVHHVATRVRVRLSALASETDVLCAINRECREMMEELPALDNIPTFFTPFGVDPGFFRPHEEGRTAIRKRLGVPEDVILLGLSAKKSSDEDQRKGFDRYFALLHKLKETHGERVRLVVFGPGPEHHFGWSIEDFPEEVRGLVLLPGFLPAEEIPVMYSGLDFYICLSRLEGGPYPVMECMSCGVRTISTRVGIVEELIEDGRTGFLVGGQDFLERVPRLLDEWKHGDDQSRAMQEAAREEILRKRSWKAVVDRSDYPAIYRTALDSWRSRPLPQKWNKRVRYHSALWRDRLRGGKATEGGVGGEN